MYLCQEEKVPVSLVGGAGRRGMPRPVITVISVWTACPSPLFVDVAVHLLIPMTIEVIILMPLTKTPAVTNSS